MMDDRQVAFVGTHSRPEENGVFGFHVDDDGVLERTSATPAGADPTFLTPNSTGERLYVATRPDGGGDVIAYNVDRAAGSLKRINAAPTKGSGTPCYCSVDATDRCVLTAQYGGGTVSALPIDEAGAVGEPNSVVEHHGSGPIADRQSEPHPHAIRPGPDNRFAYAPDLGADRIFVYRLSPHRAHIEPTEWSPIEVHPVAGPRHLEFHPNGRYAYLINELDSTIVAYERSADTGRLNRLATVSTLPDGFDRENYPADIHVHPNGSYLYGSNRGHDSIAIFELEDDGRPTLIDLESTRGEWPRNFAIDPTGRFLFAENADSDSIVTFRITDEGTLEATGAVASVPSPVCMRFMDG